MAPSLRFATEADIPAIARVHMAAFDVATDAISGNLFPAHLRTSPDQQIPHHVKRLTASLRDLRSVTMVAEEDGQIVGYSVWIRPLVGEKAPERAREEVDGMDMEAFQHLIEAVSVGTKDLLGEHGSDDIWCKPNDDCFPAVDLWTHFLGSYFLDLSFLGVDPNRQRQGIGKLLVKWGLRQAAKEGKDCYLVASPAGRPLYLSLGFLEHGDIRIFGVPHGRMLLKYDPVLIVADDGTPIEQSQQGTKQS